MTNLGCSVMNCAYYKDNLCCRPDIQVSGPNASTAGDTCCTSFLAASTGTQNSVSYVLPNTSAEIYCDAKNCAFNRSERCGADEITIRSDGSGSTAEQSTKCGSFQSE